MWKGPVVVATSDRDAFQLVYDRVTILQPVKGVSELARIGPAEVRERYGVDPGQVPDFIALRGDGSDRIPGAGRRPEEGRRRCSRQYGSLDAALAAGRFSADADNLRLYRASRRWTPTRRCRSWADAARLGARAAHARELGLGALAKRLAERV